MTQYRTLLVFSVVSRVPRYHTIHGHANTRWISLLPPPHAVPPETPVRSQLTSRQSSYPAVQQPKPSYTSQTKSGRPIKAHIRALPRTSIEREKGGKERERKRKKKRRKETVSTANQLVTYTSTFRKHRNGAQVRCVRQGNRATQVKKV